MYVFIYVRKGVLVCLQNTINRYRLPIRHTQICVNVYLYICQEGSVGLSSEHYQQVRFANQTHTDLCECISLYMSGRECWFVCRTLSTDIVCQSDTQICVNVYLLHHLKMPTVYCHNASMRLFIRRQLSVRIFCVHRCVANNT